MNPLVPTKHSAERTAQRSLRINDPDLIALIGTAVEDGYLVRTKDYQEIERALKQLLQRFRRLVGKRVVTVDGRIVTAYHATKTFERRLLRHAQEADLYD
jgi:hypothetical protein